MKSKLLLATISSTFVLVQNANAFSSEELPAAIKCMTAIGSKTAHKADKGYTGVHSDQDAGKNLKSGVVILPDAEKTATWWVYSTLGAKQYTFKSGPGFFIKKKDGRVIASEKADSEVGESIMPNRNRTSYNLIPVGDSENFLLDYTAAPAHGGKEEALPLDETWSSPGMIPVTRKDLQVETPVPNNTKGDGPIYNEIRKMIAGVLTNYKLAYQNAKAEFEADFAEKGDKAVFLDPTAEYVSALNSCDELKFAKQDLINTKSEFYVDASTGLLPDGTKGKDPAHAGNP